jgi:hypothetical protein
MPPKGEYGNEEEFKTGSSHTFAVVHSNRYR